MLTYMDYNNQKIGEGKVYIMADEELRKLFAKNLNYYLELNGYNQADLARHLHVSTATTAKWCTGQTMPRIDKIQSICNWLGTDKAALLEGTPNVHIHGQSEGYYLDKETAEMAQELFDNPDLRILFDAARDAKPENLQLAAEMLRRFKETNPDG